MKRTLSFVLAVVLAIGLVPAAGTPQAGAAGIAPPPSDSIPIYDRTGLEAIQGNLNGKYHLADDIDLSGKVWEPIDEFNGTFDGQGHSINGLYTAFESTNGLFGDCYAYNDGSGVHHLVIKNVSVNIGPSGIKARFQGGGLIGYLWVESGGTATITNCNVTGDTRQTHE